MKKISVFMKADHNYLNHLLVDFLSEKDFDLSVKKFKRFDNRLRKHTILEEEILLPLFNKHLGLEKDNDTSLKSHNDHMTANKLIERIKKSIEQKDVKKIAHTGFHLKRAFDEHWKRENVTQYSLFNNFIIIPDKEWDEILKKVYKRKK